MSARAQAARGYRHAAGPPVAPARRRGEPDPLGQGRPGGAGPRPRRGAASPTSARRSTSSTPGATRAPSTPRSPSCARRTRSCTSGSQTLGGADAAERGARKQGMVAPARRLVRGPRARARLAARRGGRDEPGLHDRPGLRAHARRRRLPARGARAGADRRRARATRRGAVRAAAARRLDRRSRPAGRGGARDRGADLARRGCSGPSGLRRGDDDRRLRWPSPAAASPCAAAVRRLRAPAAAPPAPPASRAAIWLAADRLRGGRRRLDGADPRQPRRRHGPRRHALVPHAARGALRPGRRPRRRSTTSTRSSSPPTTRRTPRSCTRSRCSPSTATSSRRCSTSASSPSDCSPPTASAAPTASARRA